MTTWPIALAYASALITSAATLALGYGLHPAQASFLGALSTLVASIVGVVVALRWSRPHRARWHRARAEALQDQPASGVYRLVVVAWVAAMVAHLAHSTGLEVIGTETDRAFSAWHSANAEAARLSEELEAAKAEVKRWRARCPVTAEDIERVGLTVEALIAWMADKDQQLVRHYRVVGFVSIEDEINEWAERYELSAFGILDEMAAGVTDG